jgi:hypothetical protein
MIWFPSDVNKFFGEEEEEEEEEEKEQDSIH